MPADSIIPIRAMLWNSFRQVFLSSPLFFFTGPNFYHTSPFLCYVFNFISYFQFFCRDFQSVFNLWCFVMAQVQIIKIKNYHKALKLLFTCYLSINLKNMPFKIVNFIYVTPYSLKQKTFVLYPIISIMGYFHVPYEMAV